MAAVFASVMCIIAPAVYAQSIVPVVAPTSTAAITDSARQTLIAELLAQVAILQQKILALKSASVSSDSIYVSERGRGKPSKPTSPPASPTPIAPEVPLAVINSRNATSTWLHVLSPEKFANPLESLSELDADKNSRLNMEDYALWKGATTSWKTIYVQAGTAGQNGGDGTFAKPFILADGNEYTFNHLLKPLLDAGVNTEVVFLDGIYQNVRLQIIKPGTNGEEISLQDPVGTPQLVNGLPVYQKPTYRIASWCNSSGDNCRVPHDDYTMGQQATGKLVLRADHIGKAIFWAKKFRRTHTNISTSALYISGGSFQSRDYTYANFRTEHIKNILVSGLVFQEYTNGIVINRAENIVIKNTSIEGMGSFEYTGATGEAIGVGGIIIGADSQVVLFKNNKVSDTWNSVRSDLVGIVDPGVLALNHSVYHQHSADVIYMNNVFSNASGSLFKFGLYPQKSGAVITGEYPTEAWRRRVFLINNALVQDKVFLRYKHALISQQVFSFVQENSMDRSVPDGKESSSASGVVMQGNTFTKTSDALLKKMQFLRVELPTSHGGLLPGWFVGNNSIVGVPDEQLMVGRIRGTSHEQLIDLQPLVSDPSLYTSVRDNAHTQVVDHAKALRTASDLLANELKSPNLQRDQLMQSIIMNEGIPGLDIP